MFSWKKPESTVATGRLLVLMFLDTKGKRGGRGEEEEEEEEERKEEEGGGRTSHVT